VDETKRGVVVIDVFGDDPDGGFEIIVTEPQNNEQVGNINPKTDLLIPVPELQIVPVSIPVTKPVPYLPPLEKTFS